MRDALVAYFDGEKYAGLFIALVGLLALALAGGLSAPRWELRPTAVVLGILGLVQLAVGLGLYFKTGPQVARLLGQLASEPARFYTEEAARMVKVQRNFVWLEYMWMALMAGAALAAHTQKSRPAILGVALGLLVNAAVFFAFDLVAERRGALYLASLEGHGHQD